MVSSLTNPQALYQPFAYNGDKNTILDSPSAVDPQLANIQDGFPQVTQVPIENGGIPPERKDFNGLGYLLSSFAVFSQNGGSYTFRQDVSNAIGGYPLDAILWYFPSGQMPYLVRSLISNNTYNFVDTPSYIDGTHWEAMPLEGGFVVGDLKESLQTANHGNWILCDGQAISRTDYADLFDLIGITYGSGDGVTTFNVPDYSNIIHPTSSAVGIKGNGKALGVTNGTKDGAMINIAGSYGALSPSINTLNTDVGTNTQSHNTEYQTWGNVATGIIEDETKSGIVGEISSSVQMNWFIKAK